MGQAAMAKATARGAHEEASALRGACDRRAFQVSCKSLAPLGDIGISLA